MKEVTCQKCAKNPAYVIPMENRPICLSHFNQHFFNRVRRTVQKYNMLQYGDRIAVGLSGGKDSVALLHVLSKLNKRHSSSELIAIIIDEGIEGYRNESLEIAVDHAKSLDIEYKILSFENQYGTGLDNMLDVLGDRNEGRAYSACGYCGVMRRQLLNRGAVSVDADVVATGHNLDDEAQTALMNLLRGDIKRLTRMHGTRQVVHDGLVPRIKPLRLTPEVEIVLYAIFNDLRYHETPCPHSVEALRGSVRDFLTHYHAKHPNVLMNLLYGAEKLTKLAEEAKNARNTENLVHTSHSNSINADKMEKANPNEEKSDMVMFDNLCMSCKQPTNRPICKACELLDEYKQRKNIADAEI